MRVLIHALGANMGGAMRHLTNFLPELSRQDTKREYVVLVRESFPRLATQNSVQIEHIPDDKASAWLTRLAGDIIGLPRRLMHERFGAIVSLTNFGPIWSSVPHVFFQRNPIYYCHYYMSKVNSKRKIEAYFRRRLAIESMGRADLIVTPSNAMADMIKEFCPRLRNRSFKTLYHGYSSESLQEPLEPRFRKLLARNVFKFLYPTHPAPHKGFEILFQSLAILKKSGVDFTLFTTISYDDWPEGISQYERQIKQLGIQDNVVFMGRVPQHQMGALYKECDIMVYPSLCESFGFSMIEAMGHGLPIVAADTTINREICGEAALYYDPLDPRAKAESVKKMLFSDSGSSFRESGLQRTTLFDWSWKRYAREFIEIVEEATR